MIEFNIFVPVKQNNKHNYLFHCNLLNDVYSFVDYYITSKGNVKNKLHILNN